MESVTERFVWGCVKSTPGADVAGIVRWGVSFGLKAPSVERGLRLFEAPDGLWIFSGLERLCAGSDAHGCEGASRAEACAPSAPAWDRCWPRGRVGLRTPRRGKLVPAHQAEPCAPNGGGYLACDGRRVVARRRGRPRATGLRAPAHAVRDFVRYHAGSLRRAAKLLGVSHEILRHYSLGIVPTPPKVGAIMCPEPTGELRGPVCAAPGALVVPRVGGECSGRVLGFATCRAGGVS